MGYIYICIYIYLCVCMMYIIIYQQSDSFNPYFSLGMCLELGPRGLGFFSGLISHFTQLGLSHLDPSSFPIWACPEVVSDFDTFTVGSKNMVYESLPSEQDGVMDWSTAGAIAPENKHEAHVVRHFLKYQNWISPKRYFRFFLGLAESSRRRWRERERGLVYEGLVIYPLVSHQPRPACMFLFGVWPAIIQLQS